MWNRRPRHGPSKAPAFAAAVIALWTLLPAAAAVPADPRLRLETRRDSEGGTVLVGTCRVFENRDAGTGREIDLHLMVLKATGPDPKPDPVFWLHGGPGVAATSSVGGYIRSWMRRDRDIVLLDQRGTGKSNGLPVPLPGNDGNIQGYLDPIFQAAPFRAALADLEKRADLRFYTTPIAMDDLNEVRSALGYERINLLGGSYGTRAALVYIRRHPDTVRCAILNGVAPTAFINPLFHARAAQVGLERIFEEVEADPLYRRAFPGLRRKFETVLERLAGKPVQVTVRHPARNERIEVTLTREAFAEALRVLMYYMDTNRRVPRLLLQSYEGDFEPFAAAGIMARRRLRNIISFGMLLCVTGSEDIPRIDRRTIPELTRGTFLGDGRVRRQMAVAEIWPRGRVPDNYGDPVRSDVPALFLSGTHDPVTPPEWGAEAARHFSRGLHLVVPGAHGVGGPIVQKIMADFLENASVRKLDISRIDSIRLPRFELPPKPQKKSGPF